MTALYFDRLPSPLGSLLLAHAGDQLCALDFDDYEIRFRKALTQRFGGVATIQKPMPDAIREALHAYLGGNTDALRDVPVHTSGTRFQQQVWAALRRIPAGETWSYAELARAIGQPGASRAVGMANARNPVAIVVPCHRVIGSDGQLTGYAGGMERKRWLLEHEGVLCALDSDRVPVRNEHPSSLSLF